MRIGSAKSADNFAIRAEFAVAESCMILKLCMIAMQGHYVREPLGGTLISTKAVEGAGLRVRTVAGP